jgi:hypothetical protein
MSLQVSHEHLQEADRQIVEARQRVIEQKRRIADLQREGRSAVGSMELLRELNVSLRIMTEHRAIIARRLERRVRPGA